MNDSISLNGIWELGYCEQGRGIRPPYTLKCPVPSDARKILTFHGLDCTADIWLNNVYLGRHDNAFVEIEYDVCLLRPAFLDALRLMGHPQLVINRLLA